MPFGLTVCLLLAGISDPENAIELQSPALTFVDDVSLAVSEGGTLQQVHVHEGDEIRAGDLLSVLDRNVQTAELKRVEQQLAIAQAKASHHLPIQLAEKAFGMAAAELARAESANAQFDDAVTQAELDKLRFAREKAQLEVEQARFDQHLAELNLQLLQSELEVARQRLARRELRAPLDGIVLDVRSAVGESTEPGTVFCRVVKMDRLRLEGFLTVDTTVESGQRVIVTVPSTGQVAVGTVSFVDPEVSRLAQQYRVRAIIDNRAGVLRPGLSVTATIEPR